MSIKKLKIGVIGCGEIAAAKHLPSLKKQEEAELVGFCDIMKSKAEEAKHKYGTEHAYACTSYETLLNDESIDVVYVCTPNNTHSEITIKALQAGKHVMCEKPMANSYANAEKMFLAAAKSKKKLSIAFQNRFRADSQYLFKLAEEGYFGEIYRVKAFALRRRGVPTWGVFLDKEIQGGGPLIDIGSHALDLSFWLMKNYDVKYVVGNCYHKLSGMKEAANRFGSWDPDRFEVEDSAFATIVMKNGATVMLETAYAINMDVSFERPGVTVCGTKAGAEMGKELVLNSEKYGRLHTTCVDLELGGHMPGGKQESPGEMESRLFIDCILKDTDPFVKPHEALVVSRVVEAVYASSKSGQPVFFD
jgi:predicted dehydrogenase